MVKEKKKRIKISGNVSEEARNMLLELGQLEFPFHGSAQTSATLEMIIKKVYCLRAMTPNQIQYFRDLGTRDLETLKSLNADG